MKRLIYVLLLSGFVIGCSEDDAASPNENNELPELQSEIRLQIDGESIVLDNIVVDHLQEVKDITATISGQEYPKVEFRIWKEQYSYQTTRILRIFVTTPTNFAIGCSNGNSTCSMDSEITSNTLNDVIGSFYLEVPASTGFSGHLIENGEIEIYY